MRRLQTLAIAVLLASPTFAHPGHGAVPSETAPVLHTLSSGAHLGGVVAVVVAAVTAALVLRHRSRIAANEL